MHRGTTFRAATTALTALAVVAAGLVASSGAAHAAGGLGESGKATYVVSDSGKPVSVTQTVTVTNEQAPTATKFFYWDGYSLWLPNGGSNLKAVSNGLSLPVTTKSVDGQKYADVAFPNPLRHGQSRTFTVTYAIRGAPPRSATPGRVGKGFAAIDVYSPGDAGRASVEIVAPRWMTLDLAEDYDESHRGDNRVATLRGGGPNGLWSLLSLRDPSQTLKKEVMVDDHAFDVVAFPGDTAWVAHITTSLPPILRELERLTGQDWPTARTTIAEDFSRQVYGWDGTYTDGNISISEATDPALLAHELAHAWANYTRLDQRWLTEGLAQELATQVMATTKGKDQKRDKVTPTHEGAFPLAEWTDTSDSATEAEDFAYPAAWNAVHALVAGATATDKPDLFRALTSGHTIYDAPSDDAPVSASTGWQQAYDLFEVTGGNTRTRSIMTTWVTGDAVGPQITARDAARAAYVTQDKADGAWAQPRGVRMAMASWNFPDAQAGLAQTRAMAAHAASAQAAGTKVGLDSSVVRTAYEQANGSDAYRDVDARLTAFSRQATTYGELRSDLEDANPLAALGGLVLQPERHLDRAESAITEGNAHAADLALETADTTAGLATLLGAGVVVGLLLVLAGLVLVLVLSRRRARRRSALALAPRLEPGGLGGEVAIGQPLEEQPTHDLAEQSRLLDRQPNA